MLLTINMNWKHGFRNTGQIGDTIGGITAPFVGLLSAYLVYISFKAQIAANNKFAESRTHDLQIQTLNSWVLFINDAINQFEYKTYKGNFGILLLTNELNKIFETVTAPIDDTERNRIIVEIESIESVKLQEVYALLIQIRESFRYVKKMYDNKIDYWYHVMQISLLFDRTFYIIDDILKHIDKYHELNLHYNLTRLSLYRDCVTLQKEVLALTKKN